MRSYMSGLRIYKKVPLQYNKETYIIMIKREMDMWKEFKEFALKGNVLDMAVGVVIGGAFGKIVTSVVNDLIMPLFGFLTAGVDFKELKWVLSEAVMDGDTVVKAAASVNYGMFIQNVIDFVLIALSIFFMIKLINRTKNLSKKKKELAPEEGPVPPTETELLVEIRDLLSKQEGK